MSRSLTATTVIMVVLGIAISWPVGVGITWLVRGEISLRAILICLAVRAAVIPPHVFL